jgi:oligopeptide/dipeptide ABC transporter ATP-binding protein
MALLEVEDLCVQFRTRHGTVRVVDGVSFAVEAGQVLGIVGESGCGKSVTALSLLRLLPRTARITGGHIRFDGQDLPGLPERAMRRVRGNQLAMIFQDPMTSLNPTVPIGRQIAEAYYLHRGNWTAATQRAAELLDAVGVPAARDRLGDYPHQFSGGMRQRVMIAMALACSPKLLIADEPTTALDVTIQAQILQLLVNLQHQLGMAVVLITHDMGVVAETTDRVLVLYAGQVVEQGATGSLFTRRLHPYTEALLRCVPRIDTGGDAPRGGLTTIQGTPPDPAHLPPGCRFAPRCTQASEQCCRGLRSPAPDRQVACFFPMLEDLRAPVQAGGRA